MYSIRSTFSFMSVFIKDKLFLSVGYSFVNLSCDLIHYVYTCVRDIDPKSSVYCNIKSLKVNSCLKCQFFFKISISV